MGARVRRSRAHALGERPLGKRAEMVVLQQHRVEQTDPVQRRAAAAGRVLLQRPQAGQRLARVADLRARAAHRLDEPRRGGRVPREQREEIEDRPLVREQRREGSFDRRDPRARRDARAVGDQRRKHKTRAARDDLGHGKSRDHAVGAAHDGRPAAQRRRDRRGARHVAGGAEILGKRARHRVLGVRTRERVEERGQRERVPVGGMRTAHVRAPPASSRPAPSRDPRRACPRSSRRRARRSRSAE